jgi:hypothetical protein
MSKPVCCPECGMSNIRSIDNQPLYHPSKQEVEKGVPNWDNEIYVEFMCDRCNPEGKGKTFTITFALSRKD